MAEPSLEILFRRCHKDIEQFFSQRLDRPGLAEDFSQEAFLRLIRTRGSVLLQDARAYLYRTARNLLVDYYRHRARQPTISSDPELLAGIEDSAPRPDTLLESQQTLDALRAAIDSLPARGREVFLLHRFEGLEYSAIAKRLGISPNTVMVHMARALAHCQRQMKAQCGKQ